MQKGTTLISAIPGTGFDQVIQRFSSSLQNHPLSTWLILPTQRLIRAAQHHLITSKIPFLPDHICTLDQFCESLVTGYGGSIRPVSPAAARIMLSDVMHKHEKELSLFYAQRAPSAKTLQDLQTLITVITRREISYPGCLKELQSQKSEQIDLVITAYKNQLTELNLVDTDTLLVWTISFLLNAPPDLCARTVRDVYFYGLFEPMPLEKKLITTVLETSLHGEYVIPSGSDTTLFRDTGDWIKPVVREAVPDTEAGSLRTAIFSSERRDDSFLVLPGVSLTASLDPANEMRQIAEEIVCLHAGGVPYSDITIAFPDIRYALLYAAEIFSDYDIPYISSSAPLLIHSPLAMFFMQFLELVEKGLRYEDFILLIQSPYLVFWWIRKDQNESTKENETDVNRCERPGEDTYTGKSCLLSYKNIEIISRTYGISSGFVDWERQTERILEIIAEQEVVPEDSLKSPGVTRQKRGYMPKRPLPVHEIISTLEGIQALMTACKKMNGKRSIRDQIQVFKEVLSAIGAPVPDTASRYIGANRSLSEEERMVIKTFSVILDELQNLARSGTITEGIPDKLVPVGRFITLLRLFFQDRAGGLNPEAEGVLLTGIREIAHQNYQYLFIASLNEGLIPRLSTRLPFTNGSENSRMETRSLSDILRQERYQFIAALLAGTKHTYLSYHQHRDERSTLSSPFLDPLRKKYELPEWGADETKADENYVPDEKKLLPDRSAHSRASQRVGECIREERWDDVFESLDEEEDISSVLHRIAIERTYRFRLNRSVYDGIVGSAPDVRQRLAGRFGPEYRWSASMLESYAKCPFRFYLERVVRIKPLADLGSDLSPTAKGSLIHTVLCRFTRELQGQEKLPIQKAGYGDAITAITAIANDEFEKVPYKTPLWYAKKKQLIGGDDIGSGIFEKFVSAEIERLSPDEKGRIPAPFIPRYFEFSFGAVPDQDDDPASQDRPIDLSDIAKDIREQIGEAGEGQAGYTDSCREPVLFSGKIDRIDMTSDGRFGVVDYKTGIKIPSTTEIAQMKALQLPLYIQAFAKIMGKTGVYGSYCHISRTISHSLSLYNPAYKNELPGGKRPRSEPDWQKILNTSVLDACNYVSRIHDGIFPIHPCTSCSPDWYCPYNTICRFQPDRGSRLCEWMLYSEPEPGLTMGEEPEVGEGTI